MANEIPEEVIDHVRRVFAKANREATKALARQPAIHEEQLDFQVFAEIDKVGPRLLPGSGATVQIETHWLGGRRHFERRWEIADIAVAVSLRRAGELLWRKIALLQSKRLYSREIPVTELEKSDYSIGIGRLIDKGSHVAVTRPRRFRFVEDCVYGALVASGEQESRITEYMKQSKMPVYYSLYNPPTLPFEGIVPSERPKMLKSADIRCGCRVMAAAEVHEILSQLPVGKPPTFSELTLINPKNNETGSPDAYSKHGWRLESFIADEVLRCREGRKFTQTDDPDLYALLYGRSGPIASAIVIEINLGNDEGAIPLQRVRARRPRALDI